MSVYKDEKRNSWYVKFRYVDYYGVKKQTTKRGFATKREASEWETAEKMKRNFNLDMTFSKFYEIYEVDVRHRVKETTWGNNGKNKNHTILWRKKNDRYICKGCKTLAERND